MANTNSVTIQNLEAAFAGESMAHIKYRYFAKLAREMGDEDTARTFEATADQEVMHAFGHLDLLYPKGSMTPAKALQIALSEILISLAMQISDQKFYRTKSAEQQCFHLIFATIFSP